MNRRLWVKFCGLRQAEDVNRAVALGVDAVGFVFATRSRRYIEPAAARLLRDRLPSSVSAVALFMDDSRDWIREVISVVAPDLLQFHGNESPASCDAFGMRHLKAIAMGSVDNAAEFMSEYPAAEGFLLDSHALGDQGGSGERFDWRRFPRTSRRPLILAGGLTPENVGVAVRQTRPWGVDVSSGIESAPGLKDAQRMRRFIDEARRADESQND
ncbi:MAG: phosphoribosylanthranilate isomerase [Tahibacter sp.]